MTDVRYDPAQDFYRLLEIPATASADDIRQAYRQAAKRYHPDVNPGRVDWAKAHFQLINDAYRVLNDPDQRAAYDRQRRLYVPYSFYNAQRTADTNQGGQARRYADHDTANRPPPRQQRSSYASGYQRQYRQPPGQPRPTAGPRNIINDAWLKQYGLGWFQPTYRKLMLLVESPYQYLLGAIGILLMCNIVFIASSFAIIEDFAQSPVVSTQTATTGQLTIAGTIPPSPSPTVPFIAVDTCTMPLVQIISPESSLLRASDLPLQIQGRVAHPDMYTYSLVLVGSEGQIFSQIQPMSALAKPAIQDIGDLGRLQPWHFSGGSRSYFLRLTVIDGDGNTITQCEVRYLYDDDA